MKEENSCADNRDNEANVENNAVRSRLSSEEIAEDERQLNYHRPENKETIVKESRQTSYLRKIIANMDLDLLRDNRYVAIVLGRLRTSKSRFCRNRIKILRDIYIYIYNTCLKNRYECIVGGRNEFQRNDTFRPGRIGEP